MKALPPRQEILERKANVVRERLLRTVDTLDQRHRWQAKRKKLRVIAIAVGVAALGGTIAWAATRPKRTWRPLIEVHPKPPSLGAQVVERLLLGLTAVLATEGGRWLVKSLMQPARDRK
jgi:hypothetical protein